MRADVPQQAAPQQQVPQQYVPQQQAPLPQAEVVNSPYESELVRDIRVDRDRLRDQLRTAEDNVHSFRVTLDEVKAKMEQLERARHDSAESHRDVAERLAQALQERDQAIFDLKAERHQPAARVSSRHRATPKRRVSERPLEDERVLYNDLDGGENIQDELSEIRHAIEMLTSSLD